MKRVLSLPTPGRQIYNCTQITKRGGAGLFLLDNVSHGGHG